MYNNSRVAAIRCNSFRQISNTHVYLVYETIAGRKKNEKIGHCQAIVKGPPCTTNITTPGQNQHVPQANNKPPPSTETCNQDPDHEDDECDDDDEDIFANLPISTNANKTKGCCQYLPQANTWRKGIMDSQSHENKSCWCYLWEISSSFQETKTEENFPQYVAIWRGGSWGSGLCANWCKWHSHL